MATPNQRPLLDTSGKLFASPAASIRSLSQLLEDERRTPLASAFTSRPVGRPVGGAASAPGTAGAPPALAPQHPAAPAQHPQQQVAQGLLAAKESEAALLRQQLQQITADFKFNLKLLEERDVELERVDAVLAGLREAASSRAAALGEARCELAGKEAALRDRDARVASLEERQKQLVQLCERQVADARAARDEEVAAARQAAAAAQGEAAREKADVIAGYERQVTAAAAAERQARQAAAEAAQEVEHVRSALGRAEARVAEQELAMQRMVAQFEGALATLQQLEAQYDGLAADAGAADRMRAARIAELEAEAEAARGARGALAGERDALQAALAAAEAAASEAKQQYHRAMMDAADLTEALAAARSEAAAAAAAREQAAAAAAALEREAAAHARTQGLLESTRLHQEAARHDAQEHEALAAQLRNAAAVLEAERNDCAAQAQAAEARLQAAEERAALLAEQVEQEGQLRVQLLEAREAEVAARWERALEAAQGERAALQAALDAANRQLQAAHRDMGTLRLQVEHLRLGGAGPPPQPLPASAQGSPAHAATCPQPPGSAAGNSAGSVQETASPAGSRDVFSEVHSPPRPPLAVAAQARGGGVNGAQPSTAYQQQLCGHIDTLASKLSSFQHAVAQARQAGQQASRQLAESSSMLPAELQRRQAAVVDAADQRVQEALAAERSQFDEERRRLDRQLAEQQAALAQREAELAQLRRAEEQRQREQQEQRRRAQEEEEQQRWQLQVQQRQQRWQDGAAAVRSPGLQVSWQQEQEQPQRYYAPQPEPQPQVFLGGPRAEQARAPPRRLVSSGSSAGLDLPVLRLSPSPSGAALGPAPQRRSVSQALAAEGSPLPAAAPASSHAGSRQAASPAAAPQPPAARATASFAPAAGSSRTAPLRAALGTLGAAPPRVAPPPSAAASTHGGEDPLARARRQVLAAKSYLSQVAALGGQLAQDASGGS